MDAGAVIALVGVAVSLLTAVLGWIIKFVTDRNKELRQQLDKERITYQAKQELLEKTIDAREELIDTLRRQVDRLEITATLQDKFFGSVTRQIGQQPIRGDGP